MKVVVLMGGTSAEREISLRTGAGIAAALRKRGHEVTALDAADGAVLPPGAETARALPAGRALPAAAPAAAVVPRGRVFLAQAAPLRDADLVFLALHGGAGEDGTIQALLDLAGRPYTGSGMLASALAMDKAMSKRLFEHAGIPTPAWRLYHAGEPARPTAADAEALGGFPIVVKPNEEGSTFGLTIVKQAAGLESAFDEAVRFSPNVLVEAYIPGRELTVAVLGDEALPVIEIVPQHGLYDYECKYTPGMSRYICPAELPDDVTERLKELSLLSCRTLGTSGVVRVDFRLAPDGTPYCLELNTIPGMTATSLVPMAAKARGLSFEDLCERIAALALARFEAERLRGAPGTPQGTASDAAPGRPAAR